MSFFLGLAVESASLSSILREIRWPLHASDASDTPMGAAARQTWTDAGVVFLEHGVGSGRLVGNQTPDENDLRADLAAAVRHLALRFHSPVAFIYHWYSGELDKEQITMAGQTSAPLKDLDKLIGNLREDVRYLVIPERGERIPRGRGNTGTAGADVERAAAEAEGYGPPERYQLRGRAGGDDAWSTSRIHRARLTWWIENSTPPAEKYVFEFLDISSWRSGGAPGRFVPRETLFWSLRLYDDALVIADAMPSRAVELCVYLKWGKKHALAPPRTPSGIIRQMDVSPPSLLVVTPGRASAREGPLPFLGPDMKLTTAQEFPVATLGSATSPRVLRTCQANFLEYETEEGDYSRYVLVSRRPHAKA